MRDSKLKGDFVVWANPPQFEKYDILKKPIYARIVDVGETKCNIILMETGESFEVPSKDVHAIQIDEALVLKSGFTKKSEGEFVYNGSVLGTIGFSNMPGDFTIRLPWHFRDLSKSNVQDLSILSQRETETKFPSLLNFNDFLKFANQAGLELSAEQLLFTR